jgi:HK97 family phage major capsid protein
MDEVLNAIEASNRAFADFKASINGRLGDIERHTAKMTNRPNNGGASDGALSADNGEIRAFNRYLKSGDAAELKSLNITNSAEGGYAVPKVIDQSIESLMLLQSPIRRAARVQQISTSDYHQLVNLRGTASGWVGETTARTETEAPKLADIVPPMGELYAMPLATQFMLDDVQFNASQWIAENVADEFSRSESSAFVNGNGVTRPKGLLTYPVALTDDSSRPFGTIQIIKSGVNGAFVTPTATASPFDVLWTTITSLKTAYRNDAAWYTAPSTLASLMTVKDTVGRPILIPPYTAGAPATLCGYPVQEDEMFPAMATGSLSVAFANMRRAYLIVDRIGTRILQDPYSFRPYVAFYCTRRTGGALMNSESVKLIQFSA